MNNDKLKVLVELRTCFEGYSGIPQENRLMFRSLHTLDNVDVTGLINHGSRQLSAGLRPGFWGRRLKPRQSIARLSRVAISVKEDPLESFIGRFARYLEKRTQKQVSRVGALFGRMIRVDEFDGDDFGDFVWTSLFSKSLPASDYDMMRTARYANMRPPSDMLHGIAIEHMQSALKLWPLPMVNTRNYDVLLSQMPWPTRLTPNTLPIVRYHDAIPVFLPHTLGNSRLCQAAHLAALDASLKTAVFACNSENTRGDVLKIYPELEDRAVVVHDMVSREYFEEKANAAYVTRTIRSHICPDTEPKFLTSREKQRFYEKHLVSKQPRFLLMVSQIQPRKNHAKLLAAWDYLKNHGYPDLKLVILGELGWDYKRTVESMAPMQEEGELFHLHRVSAGQLRILYREAAAVVCPSVAEGFDLTGIEAMLCGGAVAASDLPTHREVYQDACEYFNPYSVLDQAKAIERVISLDMPGRREELVEAGLRLAPRYRAENITPIWHDLFERVKRKEFKPSKWKMLAK